jgi:hypothetical protein
MLLQGLALLFSLFREWCAIWPFLCYWGYLCLLTLEALVFDVEYFFSQLLLELSRNRPRDNK